MMRVSSRAVVVPSLAAFALALVACAAEAPSAAPPVVPVAVAAVQPAPPVVAVVAPVAPPVVEPPDHVAEELREQHRHHHHGGVTMFIAMSMDTLAVAPDNRPKLDRIQAVLADAMDPAQDAERNVVGVLADAVQAGKVDAARVDAAIALLATAASAGQAKTVSALSELHGLLSPIERATLVEKVQAHWAVWNRVNGNSAEGTDARLAELTDALSLTKEQSDTIRRASFAPVDGADVNAHLDAFAAAFASDAFDAKALGLGSKADGRLAAAGATQMARFCEAAVPVLSADQRTKLAAHLREHLDHSDAPTGT